MAVNIHCIVVQVPDMTDHSLRQVQPALTDLVPWADPYIVSLVEKLHHKNGRLLGGTESEGRRDRREVSELPPPSPFQPEQPQLPRGDWFRRHGWPN